MSSEMLKYAYNAGLEEALHEAGMNKEAFWGALANIGKGIFTTGKTFGKGMYSVPTKVLQMAGVSKPVAREAVGGGFFGGGLGALMADPGERTSGFLKGFGAGALGGLGWGYGSRAATKMMGGLAKSRAMQKYAPNVGQRMQQVAGIGKFKEQGPIGWGELFRSPAYSPGEAAKLLGAKTLISVPAFGAAMGASTQAEEVASKHISRLWPKVPTAAPWQRSLRRVHVPRLGLDPYSY